MKMGSRKTGLDFQKPVDFLTGNSLNQLSVRKSRDDISSRITLVNFRLTAQTEWTIFYVNHEDASRGVDRSRGRHYCMAWIRRWQRGRCYTVDRNRLRESDEIKYLFSVERAARGPESLLQSFAGAKAAGADVVGDRHKRHFNVGEGSLAAETNAGLSVA